MKKMLAAFLACTMLLTGCTSNTNMNVSTLEPTVSVTDTIESVVTSENQVADFGFTMDETASLEAVQPSIITESADEEILEIADVDEDAIAQQSRYTEEYENYVASQNFTSLNDPELLQLINDSVYSDLENTFRSDDYIIENVNCIYISKEYLEELDYNSKENIFFGYTLSELDDQFQGNKYIFTLSEDGEMLVKPFEEYDDTYEKALKRVAIGSGVILICVTVTVLTGGAAAPIAAPTISAVFAASAKTATAVAVSTGVISGVSSGILTGIQTQDFNQAILAAADSGSEGFMWGAITGAITGGATEAYALHTAPSSSLGIPSPQQSEHYVLEQYGGAEQVTFMNGGQVTYGTAGATRPDVVHSIKNGFEAIEVKNYNLESNFNGLKYELKRQIAERVENLPKDYTQKIVLDARGRGYTTEFLMEKGEMLQEYLYMVYPDIPIDILTNVGDKVHTISIAA